MTIGALALLCVALAGGWMATARRVKLDQVAPATLPTEPVTVSATAKEKLLQRLLDERVAAYAKLQAELDALRKSGGEPAAAAPVVSEPATASRATWLERLKAENPVRFQQIQQQREQRRQGVDERFRDQMTRLDERLETVESQEEAELVVQIADSVAKLDELRAQWQQLRGLPEEERRAAAPQLMAESRDAYETLSNLRARDRQLQLQQLAADIGYRDAGGTTEFVDAVQRIYTETDTSLNRFMGMGRWGRGGPPPAQP